MNLVTAGPPLASVHPLRTLSCTNPATGEMLGTLPAMSAPEVNAVVERARMAQVAWAKSGFAQRRRVLEHMLHAILDNIDEICETVVKDSGKTHENALLGEIMPVCNKIRWLMKKAEAYLKPERVASGILMHKTARIEYVPMGVVACIIPWNYPFQNIFGSFLPPLMAGNGVVIKASEAVAWSSARFQRIIDDALLSEGFSPDLVRIINGHGDTGAALVKSGVEKILFIGSVGNGRRIVEASAQNLTPVIMELGGKDPFIVLDDADIEQALHAALGGCFVNNGQNCIAAERLIVHAGIHDRFVQAIVPAVQALKVGVSLKPGSADVGAITTPQQMQVIETLVSDALQNGAVALVGGHRLPGQGLFFPPTVLVNVKPSMRIAQEEVFGPVMLIMKADSDDHAVALANGCEFGLQSSVFSRDRRRALALAARLQAGGSVINDFGLCYLNQDLPFGGVKASGFGQMNGRDGLRSYTTPKAVMTDRFPFSIPPRVYPVKPGDYEKARLGIRLLFAKGLMNKLRYWLKGKLA